MTERININRLTEAVFTISLTLISLYLTDRSIIFAGLIPILFAVYYFNKGFLNLVLTAGMTYGLALFFVDTYLINTRFLPLVFIAFIFIVLIGLRLSAKGQILISYLAISLIFSFLFKLNMIENNLDIASMASQLKGLVESAYPYTYDIRTYESALSLYPGVISIFSMGYSILAIKLIRNYLSYKPSGFTDIKNLDELRLNKKDLTIILLTGLIAFFIFKFLGVKKYYVIANIIVIGSLMFLVNGISLFDNYLRNSNLPLSRAFQWFFMIILFEVLIFPLILLGIGDIFIDFRARRKNEKK